MIDCPKRSLVRRHFEGTIAPHAERAMREHLPTCDACSDLYRRHLVLSRLDPEHVLPSEERIARGLGFRRADRPSAALASLFVAAAAAAVVLVSRAPPGAPPRNAEGFTSRGAVDAPGDHPSRVFVYDVGRDVPPAPVGLTLRRDHELAFAYVNGAAKRRLAIFGIDETRRVYWFFPAWTDDSDDPVAIPIQSDPGRHELPEAIRQHFAGTRLEIRSVFLDEPLSVHQIEALLEHDGQRPLSIPGAVERSLSLTVTP
jgi:hypothetical protein